MIRFSPRPNRAHLVRWREWGAEAFREAEAHHRPIALFLTAFWCGFCQRMDETALSSDEAIAVLNAFFVPVRVEESQRPDIDLRYHHEGWPTISFLTPRGAPLVSVNYTPTEEFVTVLARVVDQWQQRPELRELEVGAASTPESAEAGAPDAATVEEITGMLEGLADREHGGFGGELKLLHTEANAFLLARTEATGERAHLDHVLLTLRRLRERATFDARDGGFFRYSSRADWNEPHPEKLLDDQTALLRNYLHADLLTGDATWRETAEGLIAYLDGSLSPGDIAPYFAGCEDELHGGPPEEARERRSVLDTHVYTDANAHAASAYLDAWWLLGRAECRDRAIAILEALWRDLRAPGEGMHHYHDGAPHAPGLLRDAVAMAQAWLDAYAATGEATHRDRARELADDIVARHRDPEGGFRDISRPGPGRLAVPLTVYTENAAAARCLLDLADRSGGEAYREQAAWALRPFAAAHRRHGAFAGGYALALARLLAPPVGVAIAGRPGAEDTRVLLRAARMQLHHPHLVVRHEATQGGANVRLEAAGRATDAIADPQQLQPALLALLSSAARL